MNLRVAVASGFRITVVSVVLLSEMLLLTAVAERADVKIEDMLSPMNEEAVESQAIFMSSIPFFVCRCMQQLVSAIIVDTNIIMNPARAVLEYIML